MFVLFKGRAHGLVANSLSVYKHHLFTSLLYTTTELLGCRPPISIKYGCAVHRAPSSLTYLPYVEKLLWKQGWHMASSQDAKRALTVFLYFQESILTPLARQWWAFINHVSSRGIAISVFKLQRFPGISSAGKDWFHGSSRERALLCPSPYWNSSVSSVGAENIVEESGETNRWGQGRNCAFFPFLPFLQVVIFISRSVDVLWGT